MNIKIFLLSLTMISITCFAFDEIPAPISGVHLVDDSGKVKKSTNIKSFNGIKYEYSESRFPKILMDNKYTARREIEENKNGGPYDTHLKKNITDIPLEFNFKELSAIKKQDILGYAAASAYEEKKGWEGIAVFFEDKNLGICRLSLYNIKLGHGGVIIPKSNNTHPIHKKPGSFSIEGSINSGFIYLLSWYDDTFVHDITCANMDLKPNMDSKMMIYANSIDTELDKFNN